MTNGKDLKTTQILENCSRKQLSVHKLHAIATPGRRAEWQRDDGWEVSRWLLGFMRGEMISYHPKML